ncbi:MAG: MarR family transcriptional regulator [Pseudomonadota bacterium]
MELSPSMERFVLHWGEMGDRWGVNRSIAQIHALLYLSDRPLRADEMETTLRLARSNISNSVRELESLGLVERVHVLGDRRDHFKTLSEPWDMLMTIADARKKREIDPTIAVLRACVNEMQTDGITPPHALERVQRMLSFIDTLTGWFDQIKRLPKSTLVKLMNLGSRVARFVGG